MKCRKIVKLLSMYIDHELSGIEKSEVENHLLKCRNCSLELDLLKKLHNRMISIDIPEPGPFFEQNLFSKIKNLKTHSVFELIINYTNSLFTRPVWIPAGTAAVLLAVILFYSGSFVYALSGKNTQIQNEIKKAVIQKYLKNSNIINIITLTELCSDCGKTLCACSRSINKHKNCTCGKCSLNYKKE